MKPAFLVTLHAVKADSALAMGNRGDRKVVVTELFPGKEKHAKDVIWKPPLGSERCPVQVMKDVEVAVFNQHAYQDRHYHKFGTEIYDVLEGEMLIEVEGTNYRLAPGDMMVVNFGAVHQVKPENASFICRVVTVNSSGAKDKYVTKISS